MSDDRLSVLEAEVRNLRGEVRRARRSRWAVGLCALAFGLVAAKLAPSVVRAERFELTDGSGEVRGVLAADEAGPYLKLVDQEGGQALLEVRKGEATLFLDRRPGESQVVTDPRPEPEPEVERAVVSEVEVAPRDLPPGVVERGFGRARIELNDDDVSIQGVKLFCPKSDFREYVAVNDDGSIDLPVVPHDDWCVASFSGGHPGRVKVEPWDDLACARMSEGWFKCEPGKIER